MKSAVVPGASSILGGEIVRQLSEAGATVIVRKDNLILICKRNKNG
ncbi:hypothetical protein [Burkholderia sp. F1]